MVKWASNPQRQPSAAAVNQKTAANQPTPATPGTAGYVVTVISLAGQRDEWAPTIDQAAKLAHTLIEEAALDWKRHGGFHVSIGQLGANGEPPII